MNIDEHLHAAERRVMELARKRAAELDAFLSTHPQKAPCKHHPLIIQLLDVEASRIASHDAREHVVRYTRCDLCHRDQLARDEAEHLKRQGVPDILTGATFENWKPRSEQEASHLQAVADFAECGKGFLLLLGAVGTGKTHLAVAAMRRYRSALFVKQASLLRSLRDTYTNRSASDPIEGCQRVGLLILDEMGVSGGGRDEYPMLHEILDHRHGERKPTILTSNLTWQELQSLLGERLHDRLRESAFKILTFAGPSHRADAKGRYFHSDDHARSVL